MSIVVETLNIIRPNSQWSLVGEDIIWVKINEDEYDTPNFVWHDSVQEKPSKKEYEDAKLLAASKIKSLEYILNRKKEYPPLTDLADALYWQSQGDDSKMNAYITSVEAVKLKYPKGSM